MKAQTLKTEARRSAGESERRRNRDGVSLPLDDVRKLRPDAPLPESPTQVVLGIDPGLSTTGWGIVEKQAGRLRLQAYGTILSPAGSVLHDRLCHIRRDLNRLIATYQPQAMAIEELYFTKFAVSIASTAQARGVILLTAAEANLTIVEYNPRTVKIATTGFGAANKMQIQQMLQRQFGLKELPRPDDAADALAIALCHLQTNLFLKVRTTRKSRAEFEAAMAARAGITL